MLGCGALGAAMSGSGPTVFGLFEAKENAQAAYSKLKEMHVAKQVYLTAFFQNSRLDRK